MPQNLETKNPYFTLIRMFLRRNKTTIEFIFSINTCFAFHHFHFDHLQETATIANVYIVCRRADQSDRLQKSTFFLCLLTIIDFQIFFANGQIVGGEMQVVSYQRLKPPISHFSHFGPAKTKKTPLLPPENRHFLHFFQNITNPTP